MRSGDMAKCLNCGYEGYVYGMATCTGISAPWCPQCEKNDQLVEPPEKEDES